ncbi:hypothetical protein LSH36_347g03005 [Paralvinella palmiformis]|uniref:Uncharacterized protein n=1 Tax=Paralvinella palmiformis TaxID=53620 RepID=A0AAD9JEX2_9ANNE|nr:hypothetical protein LSH36_347g03005 [Paralvinella palmiformis]
MTCPETKSCTQAVIKVRLSFIGNGKRSDPSLARDNDESVTLLDTILRANAMPPSQSDPYVQKNDFRPLTDYGRNPERNRDRYTTKLEELIRKLVQVLRQDDDSKK